MIKFPTTWGTGTVYGSHQSAKRCAIATLKDSRARSTLQIEPDAREEVVRPMHAGDLEETLLVPGRYVRIGADLSEPSKDDLISLPREFSGLFTWKPAYMPGINPATICHHRAVDPRALSVAQK